MSYFANPISPALHPIPAVCHLCGEPQWDGNTALGGEIADMVLTPAPNKVITVAHMACQERQYKKEDLDTDYVQEYLEEYANLRHDIGDDYTNRTREARALHLRMMDALRCSIDPNQLRRWDIINASQAEVYMEQVEAGE